MTRGVVVLCCVALQACQAHLPAQRYTVNPDTTDLLASSSAKFSVAAFTLGPNHDLNCRGGAFVDPPDGLAIEAYVQRAFVRELEAARMLADGAPRLSGSLDSINLSTVWMAGYWDIALTVRTDRGEQATAHVRYPLTSPADGDAACLYAANQLMPATQDLIKALVTSADFQALAK